MQNRYTLLRAIALLLEVAGFGILILGVLGALLFVVAGSPLKLGALAARVPLAQYWRQVGLPDVRAGIAAGITGMAGLLGYLLLGGSGQLLSLLLEIERHTRERDRFVQPGA